MEQIKVKALCIKCIDYRDNDSLITLAALEKGKLTAIVKGSKKQQSKLRYSASPFCFGEYILSLSKNGKYTVIGCDMVDSFYKIREDIDKFYSASVALEIVDKNIREQPNDKLILTAIRTCKAICYDEKSIEAALIEFACDAIIISGYCLPKICCKVCGRKENLYFDTSALDFVCKIHKMNKGILLSENEVYGLSYAYEGDFSRLDKLERSIKLNVLFLIMTYFEQICDEKYKTLKSFFDIIKNNNNFNS